MTLHIWKRISNQSDRIGVTSKVFLSLLRIIFYFFISGTLDSCPNTKTIGDRCKFTETHTSCIKSSAIESTSQLPEEGHFCQNGESSYAQCNGGCLDENNSKYEPFLVYLFRLHRSVNFEMSFCVFNSSKNNQRKRFDLRYRSTKP